MKKALLSLFPGGKADSTSVALLGTCFLIGIAGAFTIPTLSLFLQSQVGVRPAMIGLFLTIMAISGIIFSQALAWWSDQGADRKKLILVCNIMGAIGFVIFAFSRNYWVLLATAVCLLSATSAAMPQVFALAREVLDRSGTPSERFSAILRSQISLGWVIGPPIAFIVAGFFGFKVLFLFAAFLFLVLFSVVLKKIPSSRATSNKVKPGLDAKLDRSQGAEPPNESLLKDKNIILLCFSFMFMYCGNNMYIISMPLYITHSLGLDESLAGVLMGTAAFIEIPIMLVANNYALRFGRRGLMLSSIFCAIVFYIGVLFATTSIEFIGLQIFNGIFIGVTAALGIGCFQDLKPTKMGQVTTLYSNSMVTGSVVGGAVAGTIADLSSYHSVFFACIIVSTLSFFILLRMRNL